MLNVDPIAQYCYPSAAARGLTEFALPSWHRSPHLACFNSHRAARGDSAASAAAEAMPCAVHVLLMRSHPFNTANQASSSITPLPPKCGPAGLCSVIPIHCFVLLLQARCM